MRNSEWFEYETNIHCPAGVIVDHALKITAEHGSAASTLLDLAISFADFSALRTK
jgi:hypothetical protein